MLSNVKTNKYQQYLMQLPKISQIASDVQILYNPKNFRNELLQAIFNAVHRIYLVALFLEKDHGGQEILDALYQAKKNNLNLEIIVIVDWHRAQRNRVNTPITHTNADWYCKMAQMHCDLNVPIYGVPINIHEALGVLHLKGFVFDMKIIYSGASLNDMYLNSKDKYRYDRYYVFHNPELADTLVKYIDQQFLSSRAVKRLDHLNHSKNDIKNDIRLFRKSLRNISYNFDNCSDKYELAITPLVGLGKKNQLNKTIHNLMCSANSNIILCTPYFNIPSILMKNLVNLLHQGITIEIIVCDKTANDFFITEDQPFNIIGILPYLYEINLRNFLMRFKNYVNSNQLLVRLWKDGDNSYHLKGIWIDDEWQLLTGNNLNPRAWNLDLENALLIHDPRKLLQIKRERELVLVRANTTIIQCFTELQKISDYPPKIHKFIRRLRRIRIDRLINRML